jgi:hypothetical protein
MVGPINRSERARLSADAQPYQAVIDATLFRLVGFSQVETEALTERVERMA